MARLRGKRRYRLITGAIVLLRCTSLLVNCNLQHYSGESGLTYFTQICVIMLFQFVDTVREVRIHPSSIEALPSIETNL